MVASVEMGLCLRPVRPSAAVVVGALGPRPSRASPNVRPLSYFVNSFIELMDKCWR